MNICEPFIRRPIMTTLLMIGLLIFGIFGYCALPISNLPDVDFPTITVSAGLPGASPQTIATAIAAPLEQQLSAIAGIDSMSSTSTQGMTQITLQFNLDRNINDAAQDVQSAISIASKQLPQGMLAPPSYKKVNPAAAPVLYLALSSPSLPLYEVDKYAETYLGQRIAMVDGVAQVNVFGSQRYAVRVELDPYILAERGISLDDVANAINAGNVNMPTGALSGGQQAFLIQAQAQLISADAYKQLIIAYKNAAPVHLGALANVSDSVENNQIASWYNGVRAIILAIQRQPGTNTIAVVEGIKTLLPAFNNQLPAGISLSTIYDRSTSIRYAVHDVQYTLIIAGILVVLVIFLFLRNFTTTSIPSITLPLSIIGTFALMHLFNFSLDNLSLLALTLSVGFVVDDAIVMLENIYRHIENGETPFNAAIKGSKEISFTIISMTLSLMVVFIPVLFMNGILGRLLHEFAVTICITILLSGIISLTLTPMMASRIIRINHENKLKTWQKTFENYFQQFTGIYAKSLAWVMRHQRATLISFLISIFIAAGLFYIVPKGFLPNEDSGQLIAYTEADPSVSFSQMVERQTALADIIRKDPNVVGVMSSIGAGGVNNSANSGRIFIRLKPLNERALRADSIIQELRKKLNHVAGITAYLQNVPSISIGKLTKSSYQFVLQDNNLQELNYWAEIFKQKIAKLPGMQDVNSNLQFTGPQINVAIKRDQAAALGITAAQIQNTLSYAYGTRQVSTIYTDIGQYPVIMELAPQYQQNPNSLAALFVRSQAGKLIPLSAITQITQTNGPLSINHQGQLPAVTISFNLKSGTALSTAVNEIKALTTELNPPATVSTSFQGSAAAFQSSIKGLGLLIFLAILVIYIVLGILYESFIHPLTILSGLPSAAIGALITLLIFHSELNLYSFIGIIMLIGIVKKNAIMMINFALDAQRNENKPAHEAIVQACLTRFRPIMMTTLAALMGALPIAIAFGTGAEARRPLGLVVVGGLLLSQFITLFITPVIYLYFERISKRT